MYLKKGFGCYSFHFLLWLELLTNYNCWIFLGLSLLSQVVKEKGILTKNLHEIKSTLVSSLASHGKMSDALAIYKEMKKNGFSLEPKAVISLIVSFYSLWLFCFFLAYFKFSNKLNIFLDDTLLACCFCRKTSIIKETWRYCSACLKIWMIHNIGLMVAADLSCTVFGTRNWGMLMLMYSPLPGSSVWELRINGEIPFALWRTAVDLLKKLSDNCRDDDLAREVIFDEVLPSTTNLVKEGISILGTFLDNDDEVIH